MSSTYQYILKEINNRTCTIILNRPDKRNALHEGIVTELTHAFDSVAEDVRVKVVHLRANGDTFSAGADLEYLKQLQKNSYDENLEDSKKLAALFYRIITLPKPVIACVNGHAIAGGCGLATVCDFSIATSDSKFGYTESRIGFVPAVVMTFLLRKIGDTRARDLMLTGRLIDARYAEQIGLITMSADATQFEQAVLDLTDSLLTNTSAHSLSLIKQMLVNVPAMKFNDALQYAAETNAAARSHEDCKRGIAAFLAKEKIQW